MKKLFPLIALALVVEGCSFTRATPAPVVNVTAPTAVPKASANSTAGGVNDSGTTVNKVDVNDDGIVVNTTGTPDKPTSKINNKPVSKPATVAPADTTAGAETAATAGAAASAGFATIGGVKWQTPTAGVIITPYSAALKGVDVSGKSGQPIVAAAAGKVVYSGNGLKGYGNLIIIKHADNYLSAYSHNRVNLVQEGDSVKQGQKIAELGSTESNKPMLHFELRKNGKPLNPSAIFTGGE